MKYIEVTKREAQNILRNGCNISIAVYSGVNFQYSSEEFINVDDYNNPELINIDDILNGIIVKLCDNCHYTFKFFEVWD